MFTDFIPNYAYVRHRCHVTGYESKINLSIIISLVICLCNTHIITVCIWCEDKIFIDEHIKCEIIGIGLDRYTNTAHVIPPAT